MFESTAGRLTFFYCVVQPMLCSCKLAIDPIQPPLEMTQRPHWDSETSSLFFVNYNPPIAYRYHPESKKLFSAKLDVQQGLSFIIPLLTTPMHYVIGVGPSIATYAWDGTSDAIDMTGINSMGVITGNVDNNGYLWVSSESSAMISVDENCKGTEQIPDAGMACAFTWSKFGTAMYVLSINPSALVKYDYDLKLATVKPNGTVVFDFKANGFDHQPSGIAIDDENFAWVACDNQILKIDTGNGTVLQTVQFPKITITSIAFGGRNMDILYATTSKGTELNSGCLFQVTDTGSKGAFSVSANLKPLTE